jgi:hypothetical protein
MPPHHDEALAKGREDALTSIQIESPTLTGRAKGYPEFAYSKN